nr:MAG TPA: hypothetical protein [Caudoviricetes sp.]
MCIFFEFVFSCLEKIFQEKGVYFLKSVHLNFIFVKNSQISVLKCLFL